MGLGLALVNEVIKAHRGEVWVESQVGSGSLFGFFLPLDQVDEKLQQTVSPAIQKNLDAAP